MFTEIMNVLSLGNKIDGVIDHITGNRLDNVGMTETWLLNDATNNMLINNSIKHQSRILHAKSEITSFEFIEIVITLCTLDIGL